MVRQQASLIVVAVLALAGCGSTPSAAPVTPGPTIEIPEGTQAQLFGPWSPIPFGLPPAVLARVDAKCRASMAPIPADVVLAVVDARGLGVAQPIYWSDAGFLGACPGFSLDPALAFPDLGGSDYGDGSPWQPIGPTDLVVHRYQAPLGIGDGQAGAMFGRFGPVIVRVELFLANGRVIRATTNRPFFALWGNVGLGEGWLLRGFDAAGVQVVEVRDQRPGT